MRVMKWTVQRRSHDSAFAISRLRRGGRLGGASGFTFLEIMLVVVIIGILMSFVGPSLVGRTQKARIAAAKQQIVGIKTALKMFEMETGRFPSSEEGLKALVSKPSGLDETEWGGPYIEDGVIPKDPWSEEYQYAFPGDHGTYYDLWSSGPDKSSGSDEDITSWIVQDN